MTATATIPANESNGLLNGHDYHKSVNYTDDYTLREVADAGGRITRVRILADHIGGGRYMADVSYIHATLRDGTTVPVRVEVDNCLPLNQIKGAFIAWAKEEGVFAKGLGLLDSNNWSVLR